MRLINICYISPHPIFHFSFFFLFFSFVGGGKPIPEYCCRASKIFSRSITMPTAKRSAVYMCILHTHRAIVNILCWPMPIPAYDVQNTKVHLVDVCVKNKKYKKKGTNERWLETRTYNTHVSKALPPCIIY